MKRIIFVKNTKEIRTIIRNKLEDWCGRSRVYIKKFNSIVDLKNKSELVKMINEAKEKLQSNKECTHVFQSDKIYNPGPLWNTTRNTSIVSLHVKPLVKSVVRFVKRPTNFPVHVVWSTIVFTKHKYTISKRNKLTLLIRGRLYRNTPKMVTTKLVSYA